MASTSPDATNSQPSPKFELRYQLKSPFLLVEYRAITSDAGTRNGLFRDAILGLS
jgi:hypothetical protein